MKPICLDSSGWIEIAHNGANAQKFVKALNNPSAVIVSTITLYEVWKYTALHADEKRADQFRQVMEQGIVIPVSSDIAHHAAKLSIEKKTALADSLIYASSLAHKATLWTQDADFEGLPHVRYFPKIKS